MASRSLRRTSSFSLALRRCRSSLLSSASGALCLLYVVFGEKKSVTGNGYPSRVRVAFHEKGVGEQRQGLERKESQALITGTHARARALHLITGNLERALRSRLSAPSSAKLLPVRLLGRPENRPAAPSLSHSSSRPPSAPPRERTSNTLEARGRSCACVREAYLLLRALGKGGAEPCVGDDDVLLPCRK
jgi:hypothetical protein